MDVFLIIVACIVGILMLGVNIYLLALYCHCNKNIKIIFLAQDKGFGASLFCKILVVSKKN
jgi:LMBR1 domain-containing protein 1